VFLGLRGLPVHDGTMDRSVSEACRRSGMISIVMAEVRVRQAGGSMELGMVVGGHWASVTGRVISNTL
jgi:hypothetical protein